MRPKTRGSPIHRYPDICFSLQTALEAQGTNAQISLPKLKKDSFFIAPDFLISPKNDEDTTSYPNVKGLTKPPKRRQLHLLRNAGGSVKDKTVPVLQTHEAEIIRGVDNPGKLRTQKVQRSTKEGVATNCDLDSRFYDHMTDLERAKLQSMQRELGAATTVTMYPRRQQALLNRPTHNDVTQSEQFGRGSKSWNTAMTGYAQGAGSQLDFRKKSKPGSKFKGVSKKEAEEKEKSTTLKIRHTKKTAQNKENRLKNKTKDEGEVSSFRDKGFVNLQRNVDEYLHNHPHVHPHYARTWQTHFDLCPRIVVQGHQVLTTSMNKPPSKRNPQNATYANGSRKSTNMAPTNTSAKHTSIPVPVKDVGANGIARKPAVLDDRSRVREVIANPIIRQLRRPSPLSALSRVPPIAAPVIEEKVLDIKAAASRVTSPALPGIVSSNADFTPSPALPGIVSSTAELTSSPALPGISSSTADFTSSPALPGIVSSSAEFNSSPALPTSSILSSNAESTSSLALPGISSSNAEFTSSPVLPTSVSSPLSFHSATSKTEYSGSPNFLNRCISANGCVPNISEEPMPYRLRALTIKEKIADDAHDCKANISDNPLLQRTPRSLAAKGIQIDHTIDVDRPCRPFQSPVTPILDSLSTTPRPLTTFPANTLPDWRLMSPSMFIASSPKITASDNCINAPRPGLFRASPVYWALANNANKRGMQTIAPSTADNHDPLPCLCRAKRRKSTANRYPGMPSTRRSLDFNISKRLAPVAQTTTNLLAEKSMDKVLRVNKVVCHTTPITSGNSTPCDSSGSNPGWQTRPNAKADVAKATGQPAVDAPVRFRFTSGTAKANWSFARERDDVGASDCTSRREQHYGMSGTNDNTHSSRTLYKIDRVKGDSFSSVSSTSSTDLENSI